MMFGVILSIDVASGEKLRSFMPRRCLRRFMDTTEEDDQYEYDYLEGDWIGGHHRKFVGVLDRRQFDQMVEDCGLVADSVETGGSLGVPWSASGYGVAPAISFNDQPDGTYNAIVNAYVTPLPTRFTRDVELTEDDWNRIKRLMVAHYN